MPFVIGQLPPGAPVDRLVVAIARALVLYGDPSMTFVVYRPRPGAASRIGLGQAPNLIRAASHPAALDRVLDELMRHAHRDHEGAAQYRASEVSQELLIYLQSEAPPEHVLALTSAVTLPSGELCHIPLMDMKVSPVTTAASTIQRIGIALGLDHGAVVTSGQSFHFYGFELFTTERWVTFMAHALLAQPFVDTRYVAHRILAGQAVLRLTTCTLKPHLPTLALNY